jgi:integrase
MMTGARATYGHPLHVEWITLAPRVCPTGGEELVTVAEILGHTDIRMTKRYSHGIQERKREALEKLVSFSPRQRDAKTRN